MKIKLSAAIIFKNEIRCLERCLKSLRGLQGALPVQIVMADTGATDGSRAVAERYADVLFDFPWVNDFAAARNAVLERCTGDWTLVIDCDEWLDADTEELSAFLHSDEAGCCECAELSIRDYLTESMREYSDFVVGRLMNMSAKPRYVGAIHEHVVFDRPMGRKKALAHTLLHHDGYIMLNNGSEEGRAKRKRNLDLLEKELQQSPDDLRTLMQYIESNVRTAENYFPVLRRAVALVRQKKSGWQSYGVVILREAVFDAFNEHMEELSEWEELARQYFPASYYYRIDVCFIRFLSAFTQEEHDLVAQIGEALLQAYREFPDDPNGRRDLTLSGLQRFSPYWVQYVRLRTADACGRIGKTGRAIELLEQTDWSLLDGRHTTYYISVLRMLAGRGVDIGALLAMCWAGIQKPEPTPGAAEERIAAFREQVGVEERPAEPTRQVPPELLALAERIRAILARFPADDPAVFELKNSEAYQKVAYLIEG